MAIEGPTERALSVTLRATAATSLALFLAAFTASSINQLWRGQVGKWLLRNRRYLGVAFAVSHTIHFALIATRVGVHTETFVSERTIPSLIPGATAYLFILLMTITSIDGPARALGRTRWKVLHKAGVYVIWAVFVGAYAGKVGRDPLYVVPVALLAAALPVRALARLRILRRARARAVA